ncbi:MAG: hypothetical protein ABH950_02715 [Candidatus Altiarchaeota archaeon]
MPKRKKRLKKAIESLEKRKKEHIEKASSSKKHHLSDYWTKEADEYGSQAEEKRRLLHRRKKRS